MYASFLKGQGHQGIFSLVKGTLWGNCKFLLEHFKGTKAMTRGHGGNRLVASVKYQACRHIDFTYLYASKSNKKPISTESLPQPSTYHKPATIIMFNTSSATAASLNSLLPVSYTIIPPLEVGGGGGGNDGINLSVLHSRIAGNGSSLI